MSYEFTAEYTTITASNLVHIRPTANDNMPRRKHMQITVKTYDRAGGKNPYAQTNYETNWKKSKLRLQWLND